VAAAQVLHARLPGRDGAGAGQAFESAHRQQSRLEPTMVGRDGVVRLPLDDMPRRRRQFVHICGSAVARPVTTAT